MSTIRGRKLEKIRDLGFFLQKLAFMSRMRSNESEALKQQKFISFFVSSSALNKKKKRSSYYFKFLQFFYGPMFFNRT